MIEWSQLLLPALLAAVAVFIASSVIHMVLQWHKSDYSRFDNEDEVRAAIRKTAPPAGMYMLPYCSHEQMKDPAAQKKYVEGPVGLLMLRENGTIQLGGFLGRWFVYCFVVALVSGYVAHFALAGQQRSYMDVFRLVGTVSWLAFAWQGPAASIWAGKTWSSTIKEMVDGLVYALLTAGCFAWRLHA